MENDRKFFVDTPMGRLMVYSKHMTDTPEDYPGVFIDLVRPGVTDAWGDMLCCVEYDSAKHHLQTIVYNLGNEDEPAHIHHHTEVSES